MKNRFEDFQVVEPLKKNRFLITFENTQIPCYLFRNFNLYNEGDKLIFETSIWETVQFTLNPLDIFNILTIKVEFLDPIGNTVSGMIFNVKATNFEKKCSYETDEIMSVQFKFEIDRTTLKTIYKNE